MNQSDVLALFPLFQEISRQNLREAGLEVWRIAARQGGWTAETLPQLPFVIKELVDCPVSLVEHVRAVAATALAIHTRLSEAYSRHIAADRDLVLTGALLHDVGKLLEYQKTDAGYAYSPQAELLRHPLAGAILAARCGLPEQVVHIIATHSFEGAKSHQTPESFIVRQADWLNFNFLSLRYPSTMTH